MWSSDRRGFLVLLAALPLTACGFSPVYAPGGEAAARFGRIGFAAPADRNAFDLVARLEDRLGRAEDTDYQLTYRVETAERGQAITTDDVTTRIEVTGSATYSLADRGGIVLAEGKVAGATAYAADGTAVSTGAARVDAYRRLMRILADQIVTRIALAPEPATGG